MFRCSCLYEHHQFKVIQGACTSPNCMQFKPYCHTCMTEFHVDHIKELKDLDELTEWSKPCNLLQEQLIQSINNYNNILNQLVIMKNYLQFNSYIEISSLNLQDLDIHINTLINIKLIEEFIKDIYENSQNQRVKVEYWCKNTNFIQKNNLSQQQEPIINKQYDEKQSMINEIKQVNQYETDSRISENTQPRIRNSELQRPIQQKNQNSQIRASSSLAHPPQKQSKIVIQQKVDQKDSKKQQRFRFSQNLKHERIKLMNEGQQAIGCVGIVLCEPSIPKEGKSSFKIKIDKCDEILIGICNKYYVQAYQFEPNLQEFDKHGSYLISNHGYTYSCKEEKLNSTLKSFKFSSYDAVYMIVDYVSQQIEWIIEKKSCNYKMSFDDNGDLYVCVKFSKKNFSNDSKVEIMNYELNK